MTEYGPTYYGETVMTKIHDGDYRRGYLFDRPNPGPPPEIPPPDPTDIDEGDDKKG